MSDEPDFHGAKVALFIEDQLLVYRRDDRPDIPFPDMLDLPGGGREQDESGAQCVARETWEEFGLRIAVDDFVVPEVGVIGVRAQEIILIDG